MPTLIVLGLECLKLGFFRGFAFFAVNAIVTFGNGGIACIRNQSNWLGGNRIEEEEDGLLLSIRNGGKEDNEENWKIRSTQNEMSS